MAIRKADKEPETAENVEWVFYARVSTREQHLDVQLDAAAKLGISPDNIFVDKVSGAKSNRPGLIKTVKMLRPGWGLAVWKLDRLGRNLQDLLDLTASFDRRRIALKSVTEQIDTTTAIGRLYFHMLAVFAQFERDVIRERSMAGSALARERMEAQGRKWGRPIDPKLEAALPAMRKEVIRGMSFPEIAKKYGFKKTTIQKHIKKRDLLDPMADKPARKKRKKRKKRKTKKH